MHKANRDCRKQSPSATNHTNSLPATPFTSPCPNPSIYTYPKVISHTDPFPSESTMNPQYRSPPQTNAHHHTPTDISTYPVAPTTNNSTYPITNSSLSPSAMESSTTPSSSNTSLPQPLPLGMKLKNRELLHQYYRNLKDVDEECRHLIHLGFPGTVAQQLAIGCRHNEEVHPSWFTALPQIGIKEYPEYSRAPVRFEEVWKNSNRTSMWPHKTSWFIERHLVVQLARFFYVFVAFPHFTIFRRHAVTVNRSNFTFTVSRACANIQSLRSSVLQLAGLRVVGGRLALRGLYYYSWQLCLYINHLYCNHQVLASFVSTPPSFFAVH